MENKNYEFHALGAYKEKIFDLILKHDLSELLIDILMPTIKNENFDKWTTDNIRKTHIRCAFYIFYRH